MLDEQTQSTDVGGTPAATVSESTDQSASSVAPSGESESSPIAGGVTAGTDASGEQVSESETVDSASEPDPLEGVPGLDELEQNINQPYAKALKNLRSAYEARKEQLTQFQSQLDSVNPLIQQHGDVETVQARLEAYSSLFTPVVNPETQQPVIDPRTGLPDYNPLPFFQAVDSENPGFAEKVLDVLLRSELDYGNGETIPLSQTPEVKELVLKGCGLDPNRLDDYKNIDALSAQPTGEITPEELAKVDVEFHDAYKQLPASVRADLQQQDEETRRFNLEAHKERFDRKASEAERQQAEAQAQQQQREQLQQQVTEAQNTYVNQQLQESFAAIKDDLASKVTFSDDPAENKTMHGIVGLSLLALRDPDARTIIESELSSLGVKIDPSFYEALNAADKHLRDFKTLEMFGQKGRAQNSQALAKSAKDQVVAKASTVALRIAKAMGGTLAQKAGETEQLLQGATSMRPTLGVGGSETEAGGILPPGMRANSPEADAYLYQKSMAR